MFDERNQLDLEEKLKWYVLSKEIRHSDVDTVADLRRQFEEVSKVNFEQVSQLIFSDLDASKILRQFDKLTPEDLIHRYNTAQIQGLLSTTRSVKITVFSSDLVKKRRLIQKLKFFQLLAVKIDNFNQGEMSLEISGPLSIFEHTHSYGARLSNFFPYVLLFDNWSLEAEVHLREKRLKLSVDGKKKIKSHYRDFTGYIPEDFSYFINSFNALSLKDRFGWTACLGDHVVQLDGNQFSIPDLAFEHDSGRVIHVELFHRWHKALLERHIEFILRNQSESLIIGVSNELAEELKITEKISFIQKKSKKAFTFRQFPTIKAILAQLESIHVGAEMIN
jgi:predicted nuclease of restriction endonuclease-like RecB superfamily